MLGKSAFYLVRMGEPNQPIPKPAVNDLPLLVVNRTEIEKIRLYLSVSIGRRESRPSSSRRWGAFSPICRIR
jgi:hypothetical protein